MAASTPRLVVTDPLGRRIVTIDKPLFTIGRRSESDLRLAGTDISRLHAEIAVEGDTCTIRDKQSRFGTFVNGERYDERVLGQGDHIRFGQSGDTEIVFFSNDEAPSVEKSASSAATELRQMAALLEGLRALGSGRVLDEVLAMVLDSAIEVTGAERGFIMLASHAKAASAGGGQSHGASAPASGDAPPSELEFKLARARGKVTLPGRTFETSRKIPEQVFATGKQAIVEDLLDGDFAHLHTGTVALGIRHVLCTPLRLVRYVERADERASDETIGVLYLDSRERGALRSHSAQSALETFSAEAAIAIENARLYRETLDKAKFEQELKVAAGIQQALLPQATRAGTFFTTAAASVACRAVGGDFFDYVDLPTGSFGFILGDVAGKGSPAALLAAAVLGMFSAEATYHSSAAALVTRLNHGLFRRSVEGRFLTGFYGMLSSDGAFLYCNAGHNAPLHITASSIRRLETGGIVLGLFDQASFDEETVKLQPGDLIVAFSDGITEALNPAGEEFTDDRLLASVEAHKHRTPQELLDALMADVRLFCADANQSDDMTIVMVRYDGNSPVPVS
ncbi:MAG TPA: SpoIIE family protein phosphatase [Vicinamibacterales bacterium]|jgi:sigma-B regulation protein RsbU (phosphoserine phosphatase)|nr:SpoIIE family protein phosphatase [Vicinamibacterales bacterium]